jgi:SH3-like domain-containing protein
MKKVLILWIMVLSLLIGTSSAYAETSQLITIVENVEVGYTYEIGVNVNETGINFRSGPGTQFDRIRYFASGEEFRVIERVTGTTWAKVKDAGGIVGFVTTQPQYTLFRTVKVVPAWEVKAESIIATGKEYLGVPYEFGAEYENDGLFDCSSFMQYIFGKHGIDLPRTSKLQSQIGKTVSFENARKGDMIFFDVVSSREGIDHVGLYMGKDDQGQEIMIHSNPSGKGVNIKVLDPLWKGRVVKVQRLIQ